MAPPNTREKPMYLILTDVDLRGLKPETRADLFASVSPVPMNLPANTAPPATAPVPGAKGIDDMRDVVDLTPEQVATFVDGIHQQTIDGLRVFAEHGPVIDAHRLDEVGITNYSHFQGRVTKRTRTVTGNKDAYLFGWDEWEWEDDTTLTSGRYAVTETTYRSLRKFFGLDN